MSETYQLILGVLGGLLMGLLFFGGLWLTVRRLPSSHSPMRLMLASFVFRTAGIALGFYGLARFGGWVAVLSGLGGMLLMRMLLVSLLRRDNHERPLPAGDA